MKFNKIQWEAFNLVQEKLSEIFGLFSFQFIYKGKDDRLIMEVSTPKGNFSLGLILFCIRDGKLLISTMDTMNRRPINKITDSIQRKLNKKYTVKNALTNPK